MRYDYLQHRIKESRHVEDISAILHRIGYDDPLYKERSQDPDTVPTEHRDYLVGNNTRLRDLQANYRTMQNDAMEHTVWTEEYRRLDIPLRNFRNDCAYLWQRRDLNLPVHYICSYLYLKGSSCCDILSMCPEDNLFGPFYLLFEGEYITRDRLDSVGQIALIRETLNLQPTSRFTLLDIGSGYGRLAHRIAQCYPEAMVICADPVPESSFICEFYLRFRKAETVARMVPFNELLSTLEDHTIDIAVAFNSLTECSAKAVTWWARLLNDHEVPYLLVAGDGGIEGSPYLFSLESTPGARVDIKHILTKTGYGHVALIPKYSNGLMQRYGVSPTYYHLFALKK